MSRPLGLWLIVAIAGVLIASLAVYSFYGPPQKGPDHSKEMTEISLPPSPDEEELGCLTMALYHEARGEGWNGMVAVGHAILNRVDSSRYPRTICSVIKQGGESPPCQFSWWCDGRSEKLKDATIELYAETISYQLLAGLLPDPTYGATSFHATYVRPYWADHLEKTVTVGRHVFYRDEP